MDEIKELRETVGTLGGLVAVLTNQVGLAQYRLATLEGETEFYALGQLKNTLLTSLAIQKKLDLNNLTDEDLLLVERNAEVLIASINIGRTFN